MKNQITQSTTKKFSAPLLAMLVLLAGLAMSFAGDLSYTKLKPQSDDDPLKSAHRAAVAAAPANYTNIAATGTTNITCAALDRIIIGKAGSADSQIVITDGTNAVSTLTTAAQSSVTYGVALVSGTAKLVVTGGTAAIVTVATK